MDNQRLFLWIGLLFLLWLNYDAWQRDYAVAVPEAEVAGAPPPGLGDVVPSVADAPNVPAVPTAQPAAGTAAAGTGLAAPGTGLASVAPANVPSIRVRTDVLDLAISTQGGEILRADLPEYPQRKDRPNLPVRLFNTDSAISLFVYQTGLTAGGQGAEPNHRATFTAAAPEYVLGPGQDELVVPLTWRNDEGLVVTKTYTLRRGSYAIAVRHEVENGMATPWRAARYSQLLRHWEPVERSMWDPETYAFRGPALFDGNKYRKLDVESRDDASFQQNVLNGWIAALQHHFVAAIVPERDAEQQFTMSVRDRDFLLRTVGPAREIAPGATHTFQETLFVGPKLQSQLREVGPRLELVADYGMLTIIAQPLFWLLSQVHRFVGNWGWSIIIVTLLIKLVFYKLAETSGRSMAKMRAVGPRMKDIQERYKDDREQLGRAMMELYKREKINPLAGCLPILVQIPVFIAFYWVLLESVEVRQAPWILWIQDLSVRDPFFILPVLMGAAMYGQFKLNPAPPDPIQAKVFAFMPIVMAVFMAFFPAGLVLYWITNTVLSIAQQWRINTVVEREEKERRK